MLSIQDIARELRISDKTVRRMLSRGEIRGVRIGGQWRFPVENLAGVMPAPSPTSGEYGPVLPGGRESTLGNLIDVGGVHYRISGETVRDVLGEIVSACPCVPPSARPALFQAVWERESLCSTGIGNRVAIPHPKVPYRMPSAAIPSFVALYFMERPVAFRSVDNEKVSVLFLLMLRTPQEHLRTLSRLIRLLRENAFLALLHEAPMRASLHAELARLEGALFPEGP